MTPQNSAQTIALLTQSLGLTAAQKEQRKTLITASDIAAILGVNPWRTPLDVYLEKVGATKPREATWRTRRGHVMEPLILDAIAEKKGVELVRESVTYTHGIFSWLGATPDALAKMSGDVRAVAEAKEVGVRVAHHWTDPETSEERVPDYVLVQGQVQITVLRSRFPLVDRALYGAWLPLEDEPRVVEVPHDPDLEHAIIEGCDRFRTDFLLPQRPPPGATPEQQIALAQKMYPRPARPELQSSDVETEMLAQQYITAREIKKRAERDLLDIQARFIERLKDVEGIDGNGWRAKWRPRERYTVDAYEVDAQRVFDLRVKKEKAR